jgi:hypothetical protein
MKTYERVDVYLHVFLNSALDEDEWLASRPVLYSQLVDKHTDTRKFTFLKINLPLLTLSQKRHQYFTNKLQNHETNNPCKSLERTR